MQESRVLPNRLVLSAMAEMLLEEMKNGGVQLDRRRLVLLLILELGDVDQPFDTVGQLDERTEIGHANNLPFDDIADIVVRKEVIPDISGQLLEPERQALVFGVEVENHRLDVVAFLQYLRWVLQALAPRHV